MDTTDEKSLCIAFYHAVKARSRCCICGTKEDITLHHVKPREKLSTVYKAALTGNMVRLINEYNKTLPICWPDHRRIHQGKITGWLDGKDDHGNPHTDEKARAFMPYLR